jgi:hypothetical protein
MEVRELRIGNYVKCKSIDVEINDIGNAWHTHKPISDDGFNWVSPKTRIKYYSEIKLTEEWLIKLGAVKDIEGDYYIKNPKGVDMRFYLIEADEYNFIQETKFSYSPMANHKHIRHVHQLQNLYFALTGKELTITKVNN